MKPSGTPQPPVMPQNPEFSSGCGARGSTASPRPVAPIIKSHHGTATLKTKHVRRPGCCSHSSNHKDILSVQDRFLPPASLDRQRRTGGRRFVQDPNLHGAFIETGRSLDLTMAQPIPSEDALDASLASQRRVIITNSCGEKLVGLLHDTGSKKLVILCHGFRSSKDDEIILNLTAALTSKGLGVFRFDFSGNGESEGVFQFGDYWKEAEDLHAVVLYFSEQKYEISAIVGHSKGGDDVLLYASRYRDVHTVVNLSGRFALDRGIERFLGKDFIQRIKKDGFIDVVDKTGKVLFRVTEESLMDRLNIDMHAACLSIDKGCRVFTVHGSADEIIPVEDALEIAKLIPSHKLHIIEGANHCYTEHQEELAKTVVDFLTSIQIVGAAVVGEL